MNKERFVHDDELMFENEDGSMQVVEHSIDDEIKLLDDEISMLGDETSDNRESLKEAVQRREALVDYKQKRKDLFDKMDELGDVELSNGTILSAEKMCAISELILKGEKDINYMTRNEGLRSNLIELLKLQESL